MIEARIKVGKLLVDDEKLEVRYTGLVGAFNNLTFPILSRISNLDKVILLKNIDRVAYSYAIPYLIKPHIIVYYGAKKRTIAFKHVTQALDYEGAKNEMDKVLDHLRKRGIKVEEKK